MKARTKSWVSGFALLASAAAQAAVTDMHETSFAIQAQAPVRADAATTYGELIKVARWWDPQHTWSGSAGNLSLEPTPGGCFCEKLPGGGAVQHGRVIFLQPGVMLRLDSALGPLQEMPVTGVLTFRLAPGPGAGQTEVTLTYRVSGAFTIESAKLAPIVDQVMTSQLERLRAHVDALKN